MQKLERVTLVTHDLKEEATLGQKQAVLLLPSDCKMWHSDKQVRNIGLKQPYAFTPSQRAMLCSLFGGGERLRPFLQPPSLLARCLAASLPPFPPTLPRSAGLRIPGSSGPEWSGWSLLSCPALFEFPRQG